MSENPTTSPAPLRVLVVENDPRWRQVHLINLQRWGYQAYAAEPEEGAGDLFQSLQEDAKAKAKRYRCHLALVDMRLRDDDDPDDTSGLRLVRELAPTASVIVSGYGDRKTVREALKSPPEVPERAFDFVAKEDGPEELHRVIMEAVQQHWAWQKFEVVWPPRLSPAQLLVRFHLGDQAIPADQVETVLGLLFRSISSKVLGSDSADQVKTLLGSPFPRMSRITLEQLDHSAISSVGTGVARCAGVLFLASIKDGPRPVLVKLGASGCIWQEMEHYQKFVEKRDILSLRLLSRCLLWDIGGAAYDLSAVSLPFKPSLPKLLEALPIEEGRTLLQEVANTLKVWQGERRRLDKSLLDKSLFDCYLGEWEQELLRLAQGDRPAIPLRTGVQLPAPVSWVLKHRDRIPTDLRSAIVHGRLWADSVLVDNDSRVFLANFEKVGDGYVLQDVASLEADLFVRMTSQLDADLLLELAVVMSQGEKDRRWMRSTLRVDNDPRARKIEQLLHDFREEAFEQIWSPPPQEYLWALLLASVQRMAELGREHLDRERPDDDYARAWLLASVLCERLANWEKPWPTEALRKVELLTQAQLEDRRYEVEKLRQRLRLLLAARDSYGEKLSPEAERSILRIQEELSGLGLTL